MIIIDITVWGDYLRGTENAEMLWLDREIDRQRLGLTDIVLCEVLQGIGDEKTAARVQRNLLRFEVFSTGGIGLAVAALNFRLLRERGRTVRKTIDCLIATVCMERGHSSLHRDRDFDPFERILGLSVFHC